MTINPYKADAAADAKAGATAVTLEQCIAEMERLWRSEAGFDTKLADVYETILAHLRHKGVTEAELEALELAAIGCEGIASDCANLGLRNDQWILSAAALRSLRERLKP